MLVKLNRHGHNRVFKPECGIKDPMYKEHGKYVEIPIKQIKSIKEEAKGNQKPKTVGYTILPDITLPLLCNMQLGTEMYNSHRTIVVTINPRIVKLANDPIAVPYQVVAEHKDLNEIFGDFSITVKSIGDINEKDWVYRIYCLH